MLFPLELQYLAEVAEEVVLPPATEFDMLVHNDVYFLLKGQINLMAPKVGGAATKTERGKNRSGMLSYPMMPVVQSCRRLHPRSDTLECRSMAASGLARPGTRQYLRSCTWTTKQMSTESTFTSALMTCQSTSALVMSLSLFSR